MTKPYDSRSEVLAKDVAGVLNEFYKAGYSLKELLPEVSGSDQYQSAEQSYTVLVVGTHAAHKKS